MAVAPWPDHLLTLGEWDELPEDEHGRSELIDGVFVVTPAATSDHQRVIKRLSRLLDSALAPRGLETALDVDVALIESFPPLVRRPDLVVTSVELLDAHPKRFTASDLVVAVEIVSPGSRHTDRIAKLGEYAEAGIPHYWIVDIEEPVTLEAYTLVGDAYEKVGDFSGTARLSEPVPVTIDLAALLT